jgi:hypothetical protein
VSESAEGMNVIPRRLMNRKCPCCGQKADTYKIEHARREFSIYGSDSSMERSAAENPEHAYRRGYHQGAHVITQALKGRIDPVLWERLSRFVGLTIFDWRYRKRQGRHIRRDAAPTLVEDVRRQAA